MQEYRLVRFRNNIYRFLIIGFLLFIEQFLLGILKEEPGSVMRHVYLVSSAGMILLSLSSLMIIRKPVKKFRFYHGFYEILFALFGMVVAVGRFLVMQSGVASVPTIYIAVLYGIAVIFVFSTLQSVFLYTFITVSTLLLIPVFNPALHTTQIFSDVLTNGIIAWFVLYMNSRRFAGTFLDKKQIESINSELREMSIRDGLTGLFNRRKLDEVYNDVCLKAARYDLDFAVIIMDIDHFKRINDERGHHVGDDVLIQVAEILTSNIREVDVCGRWGGEEFLIICQQTELEAAYLLAERLRENIGKTRFANDIEVTASFGVSSWTENKSADALMRSADIRLYKSKEGGRNMVTVGDALNTAGLFE